MAGHGGKGKGKQGYKGKGKGYQGRFMMVVKGSILFGVQLGQAGAQEGKGAGYQGRPVESVAGGSASAGLAAPAATAEASRSYPPEWRRMESRSLPGQF